MDSVFITGIARHILTIAGGAMVTLGYSDDSTVQVIVGAAAAIVGIIWSAYEKVNQQKEAARLKTNADTALETARTVSVKTQIVKVPMKKPVLKARK